MTNNTDKYTDVVFDFEGLDACPFCKKNVMISNGKIKWLEIDFWYVVCSHCGLKFMNPMPTCESYKEFYKNLFWQQKIRNLGFHQRGQAWQTGTYKWDDEKAWSPKDGLANRIDKHRKQRVKTVIPVIDKYIKLNENSRILEVGCGFGVTLDELRKQYHSKVFAIEPSEEARKQIKKFGDIELLGLYAEDLQSISKKGSKFDVIIFSHALENTTDPIRVMQMATACLLPGGIIYLQTPNLLVNDQMNPYHPYIFSHSSISFLAKKIGLAYKRISDPKDRMLSVVFSK